MKKHIYLLFGIALALVVLCPTLMPAQSFTAYYGKADVFYSLIYSAFDDSLLSYGIRPQLNAKTWFNLRPTVGARDTVQSWRRSLGNTEAFVDSLGNFTLRGLTMGGNLTGTSTNTVSVARFLSLIAGGASAQFASDTDQDTGMYSIMNYSNRFGVQTGGTNRAIWDSVGTFLRGKLEARGNVVPNSDSLQVWRSSLGKTVGWVDSLGAATFLSINAAVDSGDVAAGALSVSDIANGGNGFVEKPALDDSLLNYGVKPKLNAKTWFNLKPAVGATDTAFSVISSLGNNVAFIDTLGNATVSGDVTVGDALIVPAFLWEVPAFHFNTYSADSATVTDLMDSTGTDVRHWFYKRTLGVNTQAFHNTILLAIQIPVSVTPDSLIFKMRANAGTDSATVQCIVKNAAGTILKNTGQVAVTLMNTWTYNNFGAINPMTENEPCAYQFIIRTKYNAQVDVSALYFK